MELGVMGNDLRSKLCIFLWISFFGLSALNNKIFKYLRNVEKKIAEILGSSESNL